MKMVMALLLMVMSFSVFSGKFVVSGKLVELVINGGHYTFPELYTDRKKGYHYVTFVGTARVCFLREKPEFAALDMVQIFITDHGQRLQWNCYRFDPRFFEEAY